MKPEADDRFALFRGLSSRRDLVLFKLREAERTLQATAAEVDRLRAQLRDLEDALREAS